MTMKQHFELLAEYNRWMNEKVYAAAGGLGPDALVEDRGAFFGSILGTLNHLMVADTIWLKRFATHPASASALRQVCELPDPSSLDQQVFEELEPLRERRVWLDDQIIRWTAGLSDAALRDILSYHNMKGVASSRRFSALILHFFNHQTHHRGQVTTLLSQAGADVGVTDLLMLVPEEPHG